jgi:hypothetical protein
MKVTQGYIMRVEESCKKTGGNGQE